ncbi:MAG: DUF4190 domain-containing protein [Candidatus Hydrogenedentes bacterium]|nr:DUF4190 domain-containing protein [Candidatus Hydrogenedentota bacterium]
MPEESPLGIAPSSLTATELPRTSGTSTSHLAIASLVLGLLSIAIALLLTQIPAIICGAIALKRIRRSGGQLTGRRAAIAGITTGITGIMLLFVGIVILPALAATASESARRSSCANNLKCMGLLFKLLSVDAPHSFFPQLSPDAGQLMCWAKDIYGKPPPMQLEPMFLVCPSNTNWAGAIERIKSDPQSVIDDDSYVYLGYVITSDDEMEAFAEVYKERVAHGLRFDEDLKASPGRGSMGRDTFYRFREGVEREFVKDTGDPAATARVQSEIPVMFDRVHINATEFNHLPAGANVLFMDGHVEFLKYPSKWPLTKRTAELMAELDALKPESAIK